MTINNQESIEVRTHNAITTDQIQEVKHYIDTAKTIALFGHENIDQDAIGSMLGFGRILEKQGKQVSYFTPIPPSVANRFIPGVEKIQSVFDYGAYDLLFFLDFSPYDRIDGFTKNHNAYFDAATIIVIDHHIDEKKRGTKELKDTMSSSCCGLLYEICSLLRESSIDADIATYRYCGLTTDTGNFMRGTGPERDFQIASRLLSYGADREFVLKNIYYNNKPTLIDFGLLLFTRAHTHENVLCTRYTQDELTTYDLSDEDGEAVQMPLKSITGIPVYLRLRYMGDKWSGSLRSGRTKEGKRISVQKIATSFAKGGGHLYASGFSAPVDSTLSLEEDVARIVRYINEQAMLQL